MSTTSMIKTEMLPPILTSSNLGVRKSVHNLEDQETNEDSHYNDKEVIDKDHLEFPFKKISLRLSLIKLQM